MGSQPLPLIRAHQKVDAIHFLVSSDPTAEDALERVVCNAQPSANDW